MVGTQFQCASNNSGELYCWGLQSNGRLGEIEQGKIAPPTKVNLPEPIKDFGVGAAHVCAVGKSGNLYCWGWGEKGQIGNSSFTATNSTPQKIPGISKVKEVVLNRFGTCALDDSGKVYCWGGGESGQNGSADKGDKSDPQLINNLDKVKSIGLASSYTSHVCVIEISGTVKCWGLGLSMQLGNSIQMDSTKPTKIFETAASVDTSTSTSSQSSTFNLPNQKQSLQLKGCKKIAEVKYVAVEEKCPTGYVEIQPEKPKSVFYLDVVSGCYSANFPVSPLIAIQGRDDYKTLYQSNCDAPHHFQVIYSGIIPTKNNLKRPNTYEISEFCSIQYQKVVGKKIPNAKIGGAIYSGWFLADQGIESRNYPQKGVCYLWKWDSEKKYGEAMYAERVLSQIGSFKN